MLEVKNVSKSFGNYKALENVSFKIEQKDILAIIGPSGSGKSTLLRCLNALEVPSKGDILFRGKSLTKKDTDLSLVREKIGMVFQQFNLFNHLTVLDNLTLTPVKLHVSMLGQAKRDAYKYLDMINLSGKINNYPHELSGGEKQRVAIIRALMMNPDIILFDEPTSALDPLMVKEVLDLISDVAKSGKTMVIVSHELSFVKKIATKILYLENGKTVYFGDKKEFFSSKDEKIINFLKGLKK